MFSSSLSKFLICVGLSLKENPSMAPTVFFILIIISLFFIPANSYLQSNEDGFISLLISEEGLDFAKDILIKEAISSLTPLRLPNIHKSVKLPFVGTVYISLSNITIYQVNVSSSSSHVNIGDKGINIVASGATANLSMNWYYSYTTWFFFPIQISDKGSASIQVEGMEVGLTLGLENQGGTLKLSLKECGCLVKDISIALDGGASWFYQGLVDAFEGQIVSAVESSVSKKIREGIVKLDSLLQTLPREIPVDDIASLNVTFVNEPFLGDSSIGFDINGLFTATDKVKVPQYYLKNSQPPGPPVSCKGPSKMLGISLDEAVFNSGSAIYFNADFMHWLVEKVPEQSLLNTAGWRFIIPQLYKKYPNDDMKLNISISAPPVIKISSNKIDATIHSDMTIDVLDANEIVPVACISVVVSASGSVDISRNNLVGSVDLNDFTLDLKWSRIGNFHMYLIQSIMWSFIKTVALPYANSHLRKGFPLPIVRGFTLQNADIFYDDSRIVICSDVAYTDVGTRSQLMTW